MRQSQPLLLLLLRRRFFCTDGVVVVKAHADGAIRTVAKGAKQPSSSPTFEQILSKASRSSTMSAFDERTPLLTSNLLAAERRVEKRNLLRPPQKQKATKTQIGLLMFWRGCHPLFFAFCMPT